MSLVPKIEAENDLKRGGTGPACMTGHGPVTVTGSKGTRNDDHDSDSMCGGGLDPVAPGCRYAARHGVPSMKAAIQFRGHCQICGRIQAVTSINVAKHGYTVKDRGNWGWFSGTCSGSGLSPIEQRRGHLDANCDSHERTGLQYERQAADLKSGAVVPDSITIKSYRRDVPDTVIPWADAEPWQQADELKSRIYKFESMARAHASYVKTMRKLADEHHGKPLQEFDKPAAPAPIYNGEIRTNHRGNCTVTAVRGASIHWQDEKGFRGSCTSRQWRLYPVVKSEG